ncbi:crotonase/enoyl-CoA hydratase family protein [Mesorhizobium escarrei]|uniref:Enoyl-CoA hydratase n=1 Tax=Mesorhizobium escarrei TaxID=666018 RepID=A0ABM9E677_9HYPH|nr:crotonase/enoyl-CoA hydratase family protein [Mesorhizobium escarrei]CAH2404607.1 Enoyl-CoA hydratase [Mesorhizobium escarrei]
MPHVLIETEDHGVVTIRLNDPATRNAISDLPMVDAILDAVLDADRSPDCRVIILTGVGTAFSSGGNIKTLRKGGALQDELPAQTRLNYKRGIQRLPLAFESLEVPVIAAVNGPAIGAGCDLTLMCDVRIAAESAEFAESFVRLGIIPGDGGAWLLPRVVGFSMACEMALTGDNIDAAEAKRIGLVSRVVPDDQLMDTAREVARRIAVNPRHAVRMTKRILREAGCLSLGQALDLSAAYQALAHETGDHAEAIGAMIEKRTPKFTGR